MLNSIRLYWLLKISKLMFKFIIIFMSLIKPTEVHHEVSGYVKIGTQEYDQMWTMIKNNYENSNPKSLCSFCWWLWNR